MFLTKPGDDVAAFPPPEFETSWRGCWVGGWVGGVDAAPARFNLGGALKHICRL